MLLVNLKLLSGKIEWNEPVLKLFLFEDFKNNKMQFCIGLLPSVCCSFIYEFYGFIQMVLGTGCWPY